MEEEPKKGSQNQTITEDDASSVASKSEKKPEDSSSIKNTSSKDSNNKSSSRRFRDFLMGSDISDSGTDPSKTVSSKKSPEKNQQNKVDNKQKDKKSLPETHEFHLSDEFMKFKIYKYLKSNKEQVIQITGGIIGFIFIIAGIFYIFGASARVADNVIYGERAVLSVFSILLGVLIIAGFFGRQLLAETFLKKINTELEEVEDPSSNNKSSDKKEKSFEEKEKQKDNIDEKDKK